MILLSIIIIWEYLYNDKNLVFPVYRLSYNYIVIEEAAIDTRVMMISIYLENSAKLMEYQIIYNY